MKIKETVVSDEAREGQWGVHSIEKVQHTERAITLHYKTIYSGLSKSNLKDHYDDVVIKQCLGKIAEINEFSAFDEIL